MPKRARPAGNHITEYIIRTRQPVLIRDNYVGEMKKLGVDPLRTKGCFCGVPLVAYDHAIGAMAVYSDHERAFDEGHLELLRVLASEASIAIENARLFSEERTKARHLSLLNTISRNAIATLNPDEMLAKITEQLEAGLTLRSHRHRRAGLRDTGSGDPSRSGQASRDPGAAYFHWRRPDRPRRAQWPHGVIPRRRSGRWSDETTITGFRGGHCIAGFFTPNSSTAFCTSSPPYRWTSPRKKFSCCARWPTSSPVRCTTHFLSKRRRNRPSPTGSRA